jgi:hypothetical protein
LRLRRAVTSARDSFVLKLSRRTASATGKVSGEKKKAKKLSHGGHGDHGGVKIGSPGGLRSLAAGLGRMHNGKAKAIKSPRRPTFSPAKQPTDSGKLRPARILEKQNSLQMSQVFPFPCIGDQMALLFKDSISGTEEAVKLSDPHTNCTCMHKSKDQPVREEVPGLLTLNKFRSRCERGRFTQPMLLHAVLLPLHLAGLRRGLARNTATNLKSKPCRTSSFVLARTGSLQSPGSHPDQADPIDINIPQRSILDSLDATLLTPIPKLGNHPRPYSRRARFIGLLRREESRSSWQLFCSVSVTVRC